MGGGCLLLKGGACGGQCQRAEFQIVSDLTWFECLIFRSGIHDVPSNVSHISPLVHSSTTRPLSNRLVSLQNENTEKEVFRAKLSLKSIPL